MEIKLNIRKVHFFFLLGAILVTAGIFAVNAYGTNSPSAMGHSFGELEGVQARIDDGLTACSAANQVVKTIDPTTGEVTCETIPGTNNVPTVAESVPSYNAGGGLGGQWPDALFCSVGSSGGQAMYFRGYDLTASPAHVTYEGFTGDVCRYQRSNGAYLSSGSSNCPTSCQKDMINLGFGNEEKYFLGSA